jgi:hypothetical protein
MEVISTLATAVTPGSALTVMHLKILWFLSLRHRKKEDKVLCYRCENSGHKADVCTAILCLYCERATHASADCPLLSLPKPTVTTYGVSRNQLMFYETPVSSDLKFKHDSGKVGRISVEGWAMTAQEIIKELE